MKFSRYLTWSLLLSLSFALASVAPALAVEDEESPYGDLFAEIATWVSQPAGLDYFAATELDPTNPFATEVLRFGTGTESELRYRFGWVLPKDLGAFMVTWYAHEQQQAMSRVSPGNYIYGELLTHPVYAGFANDGLADGFQSDTMTTLDDLRIDYQRTAFENERVSSTWFVGWRRVKHRRDISAEYAALVTGLPPLIPPFLEDPRPDLIPGVDTADMESSFEGRGVEAGMDFRMPFFNDKVQFEAGFALGMLRGETDAQYYSTTHYYLLSGLGITDDVILEAPYDEFGETIPGGGPLVEQISQETVGYGLKANRVSSTGAVMDGYLGLRWRAWRDMEVFGGFRSTRYDDVGVDIRPKANAFAAGSNVQDLTEVDRSATYEGFYAGLAYRF